MSVRRKKNETIAEFLLRSQHEKFLTTAPEPKYRMERVVEVVEHPVFGRVERPVHLPRQERACAREDAARSGVASYLLAPSLRPAARSRHA